MKKETGRFMAGLLTGAVLFSGGAAYAAGITAHHNPQTVDLDGRGVQLEAYSIDGYNYVKLRDIGQAVGFNVYWADNMIHIDSGAPYTGEAPAAPSASGITLTDNMEIRQEMIRLINQVRRENGAPELPVSAALMDAAQTISAKLYTTHHNQEEVLTAKSFGYPYGFHSNLTAFSNGSPAYIAQRAVRHWINSHSHFQGMIDPKSENIGVGVTVTNNMTYCYMFAGIPNSYTMY